MSMYCVWSLNAIAKWKSWQRTILCEYVNDKFHLIGCYIQPIAYKVQLSKQRMNLVKSVSEVGLEVVPLYKAEASSNTLHHFKILFWNFDRKLDVLARTTNDLCLGKAFCLHCLKYQSHSCLDYLQMKVQFAGDVWRIGLRWMLKCFYQYQNFLNV